MFYCKYPDRRIRPATLSMIMKLAGMSNKKIIVRSLPKNTTLNRYDDKILQLDE